jgi:hypothetical protein
MDISLIVLLDCIHRLLAQAVAAEPHEEELNQAQVLIATVLLRRLYPPET